MAPRVMPDTNCLISALIFPRGKTGALRRLWQTERFSPLVCRETFTEFMRVLSYPRFRLSREDAEASLAEFLPWAENVRLAAAHEPVPELRDPDDAVFYTWQRKQVRLAWFPGTATRWKAALFGPSPA